MKTCANCGKPISDSPIEINGVSFCSEMCGGKFLLDLGAQNRNNAYATYSEVPFYRKQWFFWMLYFTISPIAFLLLLFGDIYYEKKGKLLSFGRTNKIAAGMAVAFIFYLIFYQSPLASEPSYPQFRALSFLLTFVPFMTCLFWIAGIQKILQNGNFPVIISAALIPIAVCTLWYARPKEKIAAKGLKEWWKVAPENTKGGFYVAGIILAYVGYAVYLGHEKVEKPVYDPESKNFLFGGYACKEPTCAGHVAGYEWARKKGVTDERKCGGNSQSFIEGCLVYVGVPPSPTDWSKFTPINDDEAKPHPQASANTNPSVGNPYDQFDEQKSKLQEALISRGEYWYKIYPFLDTNSRDANMDAINSIVARRNELIQSGMEPVSAIDKAVQEIAPKYVSAYQSQTLSEPQQSLNAKANYWYGIYPFLNIDSPKKNMEAINRVVARRDELFKSGVDLISALDRAVKEIAPEYVSSNNTSPPPKPKCTIKGSMSDEEIAACRSSD